MVALGELVDDREPVDVDVRVAAGLEVHQLGEDVLDADVDVLLAHRVRDRRAQLAGLGVDEVGREAAGAAAEEGVRERHVAPEEARQVEPDQQHDEGVDEGRDLLGAQPVLEDGAVGE